MSVARRKGMLAGSGASTHAPRGAARGAGGRRRSSSRRNPPVTSPMSPASWIPRAPPASRASQGHCASRPAPSWRSSPSPPLAGIEASDVALVIGRRWGVGAKAEVGDKIRNAGLVMLLVPRARRAGRARSGSKWATGCRESSPTPPPGAFATPCGRSSRPASMARGSSPGSRPSPRWWRRNSAFATRRWYRRRPAASGGGRAVHLPDLAAGLRLLRDHDGPGWFAERWRGSRPTAAGILGPGDRRRRLGRWRRFWRWRWWRVWWLRRRWRVQRRRGRRGFLDGGNRGKRSSHRS